MNPGSGGRRSLDGLGAAREDDRSCSVTTQSDTKEEEATQ